MDCEWKYLVYLYCQAVFGNVPNPPERELDYDLLCRYAKKHSVTGMMSLALKDCDFVPNEKALKFKQFCISSALNGEKQIENTKRLIEELNSAGFHPVILKGISIARFYNTPICRASADTDIFIQKSEEKDIHRFLEANGDFVSGREKYSQHSTVHSSRYGTIELHTELIRSEEFTALFDDNKIKLPSASEFCEFEFSGYKYSALTPECAVYQLALHLVVHFLRSIISLKQCVDFCLFYSKNYGLFDAKKFWETAKLAKYDKLLSACFGIMVHYGKTDAKDFPDTPIASEEICEKLLLDMAKYGETDYYTVNISDYYCFNSKEKKVSMKIKRKLRRFYKRFVLVLFLPVEKMADKYKYLKKYPYLYPVAFVSRIFGLIMGKSELRKNSVDSVSLQEKNTDRVTLLKDLEMI